MALLPRGSLGLQVLVQALGLGQEAQGHQDANQKGGEPHGQGLQPGVGAEGLQVSGARTRSHMPTGPAPTHSPQGNFKLEHLPGGPDMAQEAGAVDALVRCTGQAAPGPDRTAQRHHHLSWPCHTPRPTPHPASTHLLAMRK